MGIIADVSEWQQTIDFSKLAGKVDFLILRVQDGYTHLDAKYEEYVAGCRQYGIPFGTYAYFKGISVADAVKEAKNAASLTDKESQFFVLDIETTCMTDLVAGGQAFIDYMHNAGFKKVGLYSGSNFYTQHGLDKIKSDFLWLASYGSNDGQPHTAPVCDLWQYTSVGKVDGIPTNVDLSKVAGSKPVSYWLPRTVYFHTGGYMGEALMNIHNILITNKWWYKPTRKDDGTIDFLIGGFAEFSDGYNQLKNYLDLNKCWYEVTEG